MAFFHLGDTLITEVFGCLQSPHPAAAGFLHSLLAAWVKPGVDAAESIRIDVRVSLCGGDARVAQHFLNVPQVCASTDEVGSKAVSKYVRMNVVREPCGRG